MVVTPWGEVGEDGSRERNARDGAEAAPDGPSSRERLLAAMIASCAERGFAATTVADLLRLSRVSRATFYANFENKLDCFMAMLEETVDRTIAIVQRRCEGVSPGTARAEVALRAFAELVAAQPATARACLIDSFAAGPAARATVEVAVERFEEILNDALAESAGGKPMPKEVVRGMAGAAYKVFQGRVSHNQATELAELAPFLAQWLLDQKPPPQPLRHGRRTADPSPPPPAFARQDPAERILRAVATSVAEHGYAATTIAEIAATGKVSQRTFYEHFAGKEEATIAALDSSGAQMLAAAMPAIRRAPDWPTSVYSAFASMCGFMAAEPGFARLRAVEVYAAGAAALETRDRAGAELLQTLLAAAPRTVAAKVQPLLQEAIAGAVYALLYDCVSTSGPQELPRIVPLITYVTLAPFLGAEQACEVANGGGRRRVGGQSGAS